jgi:hypothetical protein
MNPKARRGYCEVADCRSFNCALGISQLALSSCRKVADQLMLKEDGGRMR